VDQKHVNGQTVPSRLLRGEEVRHRVGLSRSSLWRLERLGGFPKRVRIGENSVGWFEHEVDAWLMGRGIARPSRVVV
jgi:prophage regulatory protein